MGAELLAERKEASSALHERWDAQRNKERSSVLVESTKKPGVTTITVVNEQVFDFGNRSLPWLCQDWDHQGRSRRAKPASLSGSL